MSVLKSAHPSQSGEPKEDSMQEAVKKTVDYLYNIKGEVEPELYQAIATLRQLINEEFKPKKSLSSQFIYDILNPALAAHTQRKVIEHLEWAKGASVWNIERKITELEGAK